MNKPRIFRLAMLAFGFALALPVVVALTKDVASASGYMLASGLDGETVCLPGGGDDCANS
jgi:hypothetical protein